MSQISTLLVQGHIIGHNRASAMHIHYCLLLAGSSFAAPKPHTIALGQWRSVEFRTEAGEKQPLKVRELIIDGKAREHTTGAVHEVTDRFFVVRRAIRLNDALPQDARNPQWIWQLAVWLVIDRQTGRVTRSIFLLSIARLQKQAGIVTMPLIAALPTMARKPIWSFPN